MIVIKPIDMTVLANTAPADTTQVYSSGGTYGLDEEVQFNGYIYASDVAGNSGNQPDISPDYWTRKQAINENAWNDEKVSTQTVGDDEFYIEFDKPAKLLKLAIFFLYANTVKVEIFDSTPELVHSETKQTREREVWGWSDFFTEEAIFKSSAVFDLPYVGIGHTLKITFENTGGEVKVGAIKGGNPDSWAATLWDPKSRILPFSGMKFDRWGNISVTKGTWAKIFDVDAVLDTAQYDRVYNAAADVKDDLVIVMADDRDTYKEAFLAFGFVDDFTMTMKPELSELSLRIQGVT
jgi:hypothetical protein